MRIDLFKSVSRQWNRTQVKKGVEDKQGGDFLAVSGSGRDPADKASEYLWV